MYHYLENIKINDQNLDDNSLTFVLHNVFFYCIEKKI